MIEKPAIQRTLSMKWKTLPVCIPSYKRWERKDNKTITGIIENCDTEIQAQTYIFVRQEQAQSYRDNFKTVNIVELPKVDGLADTRQYIQDYVLNELKKPYYIDMDDDITGLKFVYHDAAGDHLSTVDESNYSEIIRLGSAIARMAFEKDKCIIGNFHRVRFASNYPASQIAYQVNKGSTPRQITFVNAKEAAIRGIKRNLEFNETGDDIGYIAEICKKNGDMFQIPCLAYSFVDDAVNSVIRNSENKRRLAKKEYDLLKKYPMKNYLRVTQTFEDGSYRFSDIDYKKYCKVCGRPQKTVSLEEFINWSKMKKRQQ